MMSIRLCLLYSNSFSLYVIFALLPWERRHNTFTIIMIKQTSVHVDKLCYLFYFRVCHLATYDCAFRGQLANSSSFAAILNRMTLVTFSQSTSVRDQLTSSSYENQP